jgi:hypothetical protein
VGRSIHHLNRWRHYTLLHNVSSDAVHGARISLITPTIYVSLFKEPCWYLV